MRTIVTAVILSAGCVLGSSGAALANGWGGHDDDSACGIIAGAGGGHAYYAEGCKGDDDGDDEGREDSRENSHEDGQEGMSAPLDFGGFHH
ncbi:hypothetical protein ACFVYF_27260 [Streptomyces sp. NPDC058274]|uniref:hypothetical protein n=1 Tax=Streptomyces sp. NPDC058274 TaxID=3346416 RepID=UPI0036EF2142